MMRDNLLLLIYILYVIALLDADTFYRFPRMMTFSDH